MITLAEIPFVRLRDGLPTRLADGEASFGETIAAAQRALRPPTLVVDLVGQRLQAGGETLTLKPADLAFYGTMAWRRHAGLAFVSREDPEFGEQYLVNYRAIIGQLSENDEGGAKDINYKRGKAALADGTDPDWFDQRKSRTNAALTRALGEQLAAPYLIQSEGRRPFTQYGLHLDPALIRLRPIDSDAA